MVRRPAAGSRRALTVEWAELARTAPDLTPASRVFLDSRQLRLSGMVDALSGRIVQAEAARLRIWSFSN